SQLSTWSSTSRTAHTSLYLCNIFFFLTPPPPISTLFPYTTLFRSASSSIGLMVCISSTRAWMPSSSSSAFACSAKPTSKPQPMRSEEHTSELQSRENLVCRLLLEKKKKHATPVTHPRSSITTPPLR